MAKRTRNPFTSNSFEVKKDYEVGYGKPPHSTRFKPGSSGNSNGRPKGSRSKDRALSDSLRDIILKEAYRQVKINDGAKDISMPMAEAVFRSIAVNAVKGEQRARKQFVEMLSKVEDSDRARYDQLIEVAINYKRDAYKEIERRKSAGERPLEMLPHPDDVVIDFETGEVKFLGPRDDLEKQQWDQAIGELAQYESEIGKLQRKLKSKRYTGDHEKIEHELRLCKFIRDKLSESLENTPYFQRNKKHV